MNEKPAVNLQPYMSAMGQLQAVLGGHQTLVGAQQFFAAVNELYAALEDDVVQVPLENVRAEITDAMRRMTGVAHADGRFPVMVAQLFVAHLEKKGLPPPDASAETVAAAFRSLAARRPEEVAVQMQEGAGQVHRKLRRDKETIRGISFLHGAAAPEEAIELTPEDLVSIRPAVEVSPEPAQAAPPRWQTPLTTLTDPETSRLLVSGEYFVEGQRVPGPVVSDYRIQEVIGRGGCSHVYLGYEIGPKRSVAVKIVTILNKALRKALYQGFEKEIDLQSALASDRFVHVYTTGRTATDSPYVVMEYLPGGALSDWIHAQPERDPRRTMTLASQVVAAVAEAHAKGIVHRDIKPENYFLTEDGRAKLGDFGLAERVQNLVPADPSAGIFGTPGYIPPEEAGSAHGLASDNPYHRDVFALGVSLYELFTGVFPFAASNGLATLVRSINEIPPAPSQVKPGLSPALDRIVLKAMAQDPKNRYANAQELLHDLVTYEAQEFEEAAEGMLRQSMATEADENIHREEWRETLQRALAEYRRVFDDYPSDRIRDKMVEINRRLFEWADRKGDDEMVRRTADRIRALAPSSAAAAHVSRPIGVSFHLDGKLPKGSHPELTLARFIDRAGFLDLQEFGKTGSTIPEDPVELTRGAAYGVHFAAKGVVPVFIPLPARPGDHDIRIPVYPVSKIPRGFAVIPAGPVAARQEPGSYSEHFTNWRTVDHDYAIAPPVTNEQWFLRLQRIHGEIGAQAAIERMPRNWKMDKMGNFSLLNDQPIDKNAAVTHVTLENVLEFLKDLSQELGVAVRLPTLNEWKRALRGNDARPWPWGNANPQMGVAGFRYSNPRASGAVVALANDVPGLRDLSPFSVLPIRGQGGSRIIPHVAGNIQKFLDPGTSRERHLISRALGIREDALTTDFYLVAGASYEGPAPLDLDILQHKPRREVGAIGILPVIQLRKAAPTPSPDSLT